MDKSRFAPLAAMRIPAAPLLLEYAGPKDDLDSRAHLPGAMQTVGTPDAKR